MYAVPDGITVDDLIDSLGVLVEHHPSLGTRFHLTPGEEFQEVGHDVDMRAATEVFEVEPGDAGPVKEIGIKAHASLDLRAGRVFVARILTWQGKPWALAMVTHHLVIDLMSWNVLASDLARLIDAELGGGSADLPAGTAYASWSTSWPDRPPGPPTRNTSRTGGPVPGRR